jgi:DNA-binding MarR family transcriptional regulator
MRPTTLSSALRRLEERGYVRRGPHPADGRSHLNELTEAGDRVWKDGWPALRESIAQIERELGEESEAVLVQLRRLEHALRSALDDATLSH